MDASPVTGQCLCGAVKFRVSGRFHGFFLCHCSRCRKNTGSAHSANLFSNDGQLTWIPGEDNIKTFRLPGSHHVKSFCSDCGSALPVSQPELDLLVVPAGSLDSPIDIRPDAHICWSSRARWDNGLSSVKRMAGLPG